jgi:hypothetical protein
MQTSFLIVPKHVPDGELDAAPAGFDRWENRAAERYRNAA